MTHHAKAVSAGSTEAGGSSRGFLRRAFATRGASRDAKGSGARSNGRLRATLAVLALAIAAFAITVAPASAAPPTVTTPVVSSVSYASAHVTGKVATDGSGALGATAYAFQISTDNATWSTAAGASLSGAATKTVETDITGLKGATQYFVRLVANNGFFIGAETPVPSPLPNPSFTTLTVDPPTIPGTVATAEIFSTSAKATAKVKRPANADPAFDISACRFEYVSDADFTATGFSGATAVPCEPATPFTTANGETDVTAPLTGLSPATTYHLRLVAENAAPGAVIKEAAAAFTTNAKVTTPPTVLATGNATNVGKRTAQAAGEVERPAGADPALDVSCRFEYVTEEHFTAEGFTGAEQAPCAQNPVTSSAPGFPAVSSAVTAELPGLTPGTTYHLRLSAENGAGTVSKEAAATFTTVAIIPPVLTVDSITEIGYTSFRATGTFDPGNQGIFSGFQFSPAGKEEWESSQAEAIFVGAGSPPEQISLNFPCYRELGPGQFFCTAPLKPGTTYQVRAFGFEGEAGLGELVHSPEPYPEFTTKGTNTPVSATLDPVTAVTATTAHFSGIVDTHAPAGPLPDEAKAAYKTDWRIECTPECPGPGGEPFSGTIQTEEGSKAIALDAAHLRANTFYEVELIAHNTLGTVETPLQTFQTPLILPSVKAEAGASDGEGGYFIQGLINSNNSKVTSCVIEYGTTATYPNTYQAPCLPNPSGPNEVQNVNIDATEGQFKLSFRGQTTTDLPYNATTAEVQTALRALSQVGATGVNVTGSTGAYVVTFAGKLADADVEPIKASDGTTPLAGGGGASVSTPTEGGINHAVTVETHVENLTIDAHYHFRIFTTNAAGSASTTDREFVPTLAPPRPGCENEQLRKENSSEALPECRAYEMVTPPDKGGYGAELFDFNGGVAVAYVSQATNIANSGLGAALENWYTATRSDAGWGTRANLNGPTGSPFDGPEGLVGIAEPVFSKDLLSMTLPASFSKSAQLRAYLRRPDGTFTLLNGASSTGFLREKFVGASNDFTRQIFNGNNYGGIVWGPGVYEIVVGNDQMQRVDVDNSANPISACSFVNDPTYGGFHGFSSALGNAVSTDARIIVVTVAGGCGAPNPPAHEIWARVGATITIEVSASQCTRGDCNAPANATFGGAAGDGSRVYFTTAQQLVNGDTDQASDLYACDIPSGTPAPVGKANPCPSLKLISAPETGAAEVENVLGNSEDGSTVLFTAKGVLAANEDALDETAVSGDHNLYVWRQDSAHPAGQTTFVGRLDNLKDSSGNVELKAQITPDGHYLALDTATSLLPTDTDNTADVYRYDADTGEMVRASTGPAGVGGNAAGFDATPPGSAISDDGQKIVFITAEALEPSDGNGNSDVYLWTPQRVSLISSGSGPPLRTRDGGTIRPPRAAIDGSGADIYFETNAALTPADGDEQADVYDARVNGGFSFAETTCSGEACQPPVSPSPSTKPRASEQPVSGNPAQPKPCPKGKVKKHGKCVKKPSKKHAGKHHPKQHKRANSNSGGGK